MRHVTDNGFADRRKAAAEAKKLLLKKFEAAPKPDDPEMQAKLAERKANAEARAEAEAREAIARDRIARVVADEAERKAERDRRYAARKARQR